jgi:alcohol dehydrogenase
MRALLYDSFRGPVRVAEVPDPEPPADGVVVRVVATGLCRSDWHGWQGHDADIRTLPHVPGHELAGEVVAVGREVRGWRGGERVTTPFVLGCGACPECLAGDAQVCRRQWQPGFHGWGSFAEYVALPRADFNLVRLPDGLSAEEAALLGCRFATSFRGLVQQGRVRAGERVAVFGCGGVGLSAIMIAAACDAQVIALDIDPAQLALARALGATHTLDTRALADVPEAVRALSAGGAHLTVDALGHRQLVRDALLSLRPRGRHIQIGLLTGAHADPPLPMGAVIGRELALLGSHGMAARAYPDLLGLITAGRLPLARLLTRRLSLADGAAALMTLADSPTTGVTVIQPGENKST